jgi:lipopolysaccharide export LptBFGC system permease protein LptF
MSKFFTVIAALLFLVAAAAHAYRLFSHHFSIVVAGHGIPLWASWPAGAVALVLGVMLLIEARR